MHCALVCFIKGMVLYNISCFIFKKVQKRKKGKPQASNPDIGIKHANTWYVNHIVDLAFQLHQIVIMGTISFGQECPLIFCDLSFSGMSASVAPMFLQQGLQDSTAAALWFVNHLPEVNFESSKTCVAVNGQEANCMRL